MARHGTGMCEARITPVTYDDLYCYVVVHIVIWRLALPCGSSYWYVAPCIAMWRLALVYGASDCDMAPLIVTPLIVMWHLALSCRSLLLGSHCYVTPRIVV